jgi:outer membrane protein assembly factor BamB
MREHHSMIKRHTRWTLIGALLLALTACASQTPSGASEPTPTLYPTLAPWVPTVTPTTVPYSTAAPGTMPHMDGLLYEATLAGDVLGINPATGATKWSVSAGTGAGLLATDHALYVNYGDHLEALRLSDGARLWSVSGGRAVVDQGGALYVEWQDGVAALNDLTGATRWRWTPPDGEYEAGLIPSADAVVIGTRVPGQGTPGENAIYGLDAHTGVLRWSRPRGDFIYGNPIVSGNRVFYCSSSSASSKIGAYALSNGARIWERDWASFNARDGADLKAADSELAYLGIGEFGLAALRISDGGTAWSYDNYLSAQNQVYPFKFDSGNVYTWSAGEVSRFDTSAGTVRWSQQVDGDAPVYIDSGIYLSRGSPDVAYALDAATGAIRWRFPAALTSIVSRNGVLFSHVDHDPNAQPQLTTDAIYAINAATAALYWRRDLPSQIVSGPFLEP